jgi:hypothetical protein
MHIGLIPLDERPVNTRYPAMIARIAGVDLALPPQAARSRLRTPASCDRLLAWLHDMAPTLDALIVSCEMLGYGGLIAARTTQEPAGQIIARLDALRAIRGQRPTLPILGFNLITRISNANDATEEPDYWGQYGARLYRYSQLVDRQAQGQPVAAELDALRAELPAQAVQNWLQRRGRNHTVNLAALQLLADGVFDLLVLSSDDTSPYGLPSREKRWLAEWAGLLGLAADGHGRDGAHPALLMYPGADEVGCALLARLINAHAGATPRILPCYGVPGGAEVVAPYEDGPVRVTVERQIRAVGGVVATDEADLWLAVDPPTPRRDTWNPAYAEQEKTERQPHLNVLVEQVQQRLEASQPAVVADVAYPNGADPVLVDLLRARVALPDLAAYGAWNTAGNTIGTALAQGCAARLITTPAQRSAQEAFLLHRFVEDWGYQHLVRQQARAWLQAETGRNEPVAADLPALTAWIAQRLNALVHDLPGFDNGWRVTNVCLPWQRLFEVDFDLLAPEDRK